jgi:hypothetical protein
MKSKGTTPKLITTWGDYLALGSGQPRRDYFICLSNEDKDNRAEKRKKREWDGVMFRLDHRQICDTPTHDIFFPNCRSHRNCLVGLHLHSADRRL